MSSNDIGRVCWQLSKTLCSFEYESRLIYEAVVIPRFNQAPWRNRLPDILHACVMWCFARVDLLSVYWQGERGKSQNKRMVDFIEHYLGYPRETASMAIQMWRHNMMHTGNPRKLIDPKRNISLVWLLHWGEGQMDKSAHFVLNGTNTLKVDMTLFHLIQDLKKAQKKYFRDLSDNAQLLLNFKKASKEINEVNLSTY